MKNGGNSWSYKQILIFEAVTIDRLEVPIREHGLLSKRIHKPCHQYRYRWLKVGLETTG